MREGARQKKKTAKGLPLGYPVATSQRCFDGKTDILIRKDGKNVFIAECKFWKGEKAFLETIDQIGHSRFQPARSLIPHPLTGPFAPEASTWTLTGPSHSR